MVLGLKVAYWGLTFSFSGDLPSVDLAFSRADLDLASPEFCQRDSMSSVEKSLEKFRVSLEKGSIYEAQQLIKTVYHRLRSRKLMEESRQLLEKAACLQLDHEQVRVWRPLSATDVRNVTDTILK